MSGRYVLLGGTGFFGSALAEALRSRGFTVLTVGRGRRGNPTIRADLVETTESLDPLFLPGDNVIYLLGISPLFRPFGGRRRYRKNHLTTLVRALAAARRRGASRFVQVSALGVSKSCGAAYGETKARAGVILRASSLSTGVAEPSVLYGKGSEIIRALSLLSRLPLLPMPRIPALFRPMHVADAAGRLADAVTGEQLPDRIELSGPEALTLTQVASAYLEPRGTRLVLLPRLVSRLLVAVVSRIKLPGFPAELEAMLAIDNAGSPPEAPEELASFSSWSAVP